MTTESMKPYPAYKDSGIEWIGEIPESWEVSKIKYIATNTVDYGLNISGENYVEDGIRFLRTTDIDDFGNLKKNGVYLSQDDVDNNFLLHDGDLLISRSGTIGRAYVHKGTNEIFSFAGYLVRFSFSDIDISKFIYYLTKSSTFGKWLKSISVESTIGNVNGQKYANYQFALPLTEEIQTIIKYLNLQIIKIDTLIENKQTQIELLKEERTAIINQAVTKGLNPDVPMRDSGIEWLGEIPEHWGIVRLKLISNIRYGLGQPPRELEGGLPIIRATNIKRGIIDTKDLVYVDPKDIPYDRNPILKADEIIVVRSGAYTGDSAIIPTKYAGSVTGYDMVVSAKKANPKYIAYSLLSNSILHNQIDLCKLRAAQPHLNAEELGNILVFLPPDKEQEQIVESIIKENQLIESTIQIINNQVKYLQEYRTALISDAVTGKIDVRHENGKELI